MTDPHPHSHYFSGFPSQSLKLSSSGQASEGSVSSTAVSKDQGNNFQILGLYMRSLHSPDIENNTKIKIK